jgi:hypothetical protein
MEGERKKARKKERERERENSSGIRMKQVSIEVINRLTIDS